MENFLGTLIVIAIISAVVFCCACILCKDNVSLSEVIFGGKKNKDKQPRIRGADRGTRSGGNTLIASDWQINLLDENGLVIRSVPVKTGDDGEFLIGRDAACDFVISDGTVSGFHLYVRKGGDGLYAVDENSSNGTYIDNERIARGQKFLIKDKQVIVLNSVPIAFTKNCVNRNIKFKIPDTVDRTPTIIVGKSSVL